MLHNAGRSLTVLVTLLVAGPKLAHADGGELSVGVDYVPGVSALVAAETPFQSGSRALGFAHAIKMDLAYAVSNRVALTLGGDFVWPQPLRAKDVTLSGKSNVDFRSHRAAMRFLGGVALRTDRKQVWDVGITVFTGLEWSRWTRVSASVLRQDQRIVWTSPSSGWQSALFFGLSPAVQWRLGPYVSLEGGLRGRIHRRGSLAAEAFVGVRAALPVGPSF